MGEKTIKNDYGLHFFIFSQGNIDYCIIIEIIQLQLSFHNSLIICV